MYLLTLAISIVGARLSSCKIIEDPIEMLNCEIEDLSRRNQQLELAIEQVKTSDNIQNQQLTKVSKVTAGLSARCNKNACGPCACYTDYQLSKDYYCNCDHLEPMRDCLDFRNAGYNISGLYMVHLNNIKTIEVFCDQETDDGGWTVFQRRLNGKTNFYRDWKAYKGGFGNPHREFWLGNEYIYLLTYQAEYPSGSELRVDMEDWSNKKHFAKYKTFSIDNEEQKYQILVKGFSGDVGDSLTYHNGRMFTTYDADNDAHSKNCASSYRSGWWYNACHYSNLNGEYQWIGGTQDSKGIVWHSKGSTKDIQMKFAELKVRRKL